MKNINVFKGITKILSRASVVLLITYVLGTLIFRAGNFEEVSTTDVCGFVLAAFITAILAITDYLTGMIRQTMLISRKKSKRKAASVCSIISINKEYFNENGEDYRMIS